MNGIPLDTYQVRVESTVIDNDGHVRATLIMADGRELKVKLARGDFCPKSPNKQHSYQPADGWRCYFCGDIMPNEERPQEHIDAEYCEQSQDHTHSESWDDGERCYFCGEVKDEA